MTWYRRNGKQSEFALKQKWERTDLLKSQKIILGKIDGDIQVEILVVLPTMFMLQTVLERQLYFLVRRWTRKFASNGWWLGGILLMLQGMKRRQNRILLA